MDSVKTKTKIYLLILSLVMTLLGIAVMKSNQSPATRNGKPLTATQEITSLENTQPDSPQMRKFLDREKATREAEQAASSGLSK